MDASARSTVYLVSGLIVAMLISFTLRERESRELRETFSRDVDDKVMALRREMELHFEVLYMLRGLYDASEFVSREEFARISQDVMTRNQTIQALGWVPLVRAADRARFLAEARKVYPDFQFTELDESGELHAAAERELLYPVFYVEPFAGNRKALGLDLASDEERRRALVRALNDDLLSMTAGVRLVQASADKRGVLIFLPTYRGIPATREARARKHYGFVLGVYNVEQVFHHAVIQTAAGDIHMRLLDVTNRDQPALLYEQEIPPEMPLKPEYSYARDIHDLGGRTWRIEATPYQRYVDGYFSLLPYLAFGLLATLLVAGTSLLNASQRQSARVRAEVDTRTRELREANEKLERLSRTDGLTGVPNRRAFDDYVMVEWRRASREGRPFALMLIDIDCFKQYNDFYGHQAGDVCLRNVAVSLQSALRRPSDMVARYGGEEFAVVIPEVEEGVEIFADLLRANVEAMQVPHLASSVSKVVTVSVGLATTDKPQSDQFLEFIKTADAALYAAKAGGRNRMVSTIFPVQGA